MFCCRDVCFAWAYLRLTNLELAVHVSIKSVVPGSQPEQNNLLWSRTSDLKIVYVYFLCGLVCTCIHESDAELICMWFFFSDVLTYCVMFQAFICYCFYVRCL